MARMRQDRRWSGFQRLAVLDCLPVNWHPGRPSLAVILSA